MLQPFQYVEAVTGVVLAWQIYPPVSRPTVDYLLAGAYGLRGLTSRINEAAESLLLSSSRLLN